MNPAMGPEANRKRDPKAGVSPARCIRSTTNASGAAPVIRRSDSASRRGEGATSALCGNTVRACPPPQPAPRKAARTSGRSGRTRRRGSRRAPKRAARPEPGDPEGWAARPENRSEPRSGLLEAERQARREADGRLDVVGTADGVAVIDVLALDGALDEERDRE